MKKAIIISAIIFLTLGIGFFTVKTVFNYNTKASITLNRFFLSHEEDYIHSTTEVSGSIQYTTTVNTSIGIGNIETPTNRVVQQSFDSLINAVQENGGYSMKMHSERPLNGFNYHAYKRVNDELYLYKYNEDAENIKIQKVQDFTLEESFSTLLSSNEFLIPSFGVIIPAEIEDNYFQSTIKFHQLKLFYKDFVDNLGLDDLIITNSPQSFEFTFLLRIEEDKATYQIIGKDLFKNPPEVKGLEINEKMTTGLDLLITQTFTFSNEGDVEIPDFSNSRIIISDNKSDCPAFDYEKYRYLKSINGVYNYIRLDLEPGSYNIYVYFDGQDDPKYKLLGHRYSSDLGDVTIEKGGTYYVRINKLRDSSTDGYIVVKKNIN